MNNSGIRKSVVKTPPVVLRTTLATRSRSRSRTRRKRVRQPTTSTSNTSADDDDDDEDLPPGVDAHTETGLRNSAARNNLSAAVVKNIIKRVCHNDHVLALVKLKEEELNKSTETERLANTMEAGKHADGDDEDGADSDWDTDVDGEAGTESGGANADDTKRSPFKLTRAKARALNKKPLPVLPLPPACVHQPVSEITRIIQADLRSDDDEDEDDEEYRPAEEDVPSDEEFNIITTASAMCDNSLISPPTSLMTPRRPSAAPASSFDTRNSGLCSDGQFKIPGNRADGRTVPPMSSECQASGGSSGLPDGYTIAQQTRSKVSLATTPIEIIEANFQPPDVDAADAAMRCSITDEYMQFLTDTISADKPISVDEDDADDDEDFQMPSMNTPFADREEMYNRPITHQECLDLFDDLLNHFDSTSMSSHPELQSLIQQLDDDQPIEPLTAAETAAALSDVQQPLAPQSPEEAVATTATTAATTNQPTKSATKSPSKSSPQQRQVNWKTHNARKLYRHLATEAPPADYDFAADGLGPLDFQLALIEQQQRQHVQLATQSFLQVYGHPGNGFWMFADRFRRFLMELDELQTSSTCDSNDGAIVNLRPALRLIAEWEAARSMRLPENVQFVRFLEHHTAEAKRLAAKCQSHFNFFHPLVQEAVLSSGGVFVYAHLLPPVPFRLDRRGKFFNFLPTEDFLIAQMLERIYAQLRAKSRGSDVPLNGVCKRIASEMTQWRCSHPQALYKYVVRRRNAKDTQMNPIQFFFKHNKAPATKHVIHPFVVADDMRPLVDRDRQYLSRLWAVAADRIASQQRHYTTHLCSPSTSCTGSPSPSPPPVSPTKLQVTCANCSHVADLDSSLLLDSATANSAAPVEHTNQISTCTIQSEAGPIIVTTIVCAVLTDSDLLVERQQHRLQLRRHCAHIFAKVVVGAFVRPLRRERTLLGRRHPQLGRVYAALVSLDVYVSLWGWSARDDHNSGTIEMEAGANAQMAATESGGPVVVAAEKAPDALAMATATAENTAVVPAAPTVSTTPASTTTSNGTATKKQPAWKTPTASTYKVLLSADTPAETNERDLLFAQNFLDRIEAIYSAAASTPNTQAASSNGAADDPAIAVHPADRYSQFLRLLTTFDPRTSSAVDLYASCEAFFLPDHPELAELFLAFLLPADAARLGRFVDHHIMQSMSHFMEKLMAHFHKQPAQMRKIMAALKELADEPPGQLTAERVRLRIVPLLRGNALLIEWWQQCFAGDAMGGQEAAADYETVAVTKSGSEYFAAPATSADDEDAADAYEEIAAVDLVADPPEHPCHIRFMNGHLFYGSKIVLPVQLSFQTVQYSSVVPALIAVAANGTTVDDSAEDAGTGTYECVHEIKRIGDKKLETLFAAPAPEVTADAGEQSGGGDASAAAALADGETGAAVAVAEPTDKCCNDLLLKAHAVRLNPTLHAAQLRKPNDLLDMLRRPAVVAAAATAATAAVNGNGEKVGGSPKKRGANALADATSCNSPSSSPPKKCKLKRAKQQRKAASGKPSTAAAAAAASTAPAASTATETPTTTHQTTPTESAPIVDSAPAAASNGTDAAAADEHAPNDGRTAADEPVECAIECSEAEDDADADMSILHSSDADMSICESDEWTRDEDKIILEQIQCGFASDDELVGTLLRSGRLPKRTAPEISERFAFLMDIIANL